MESQSMCVCTYGYSVADTAISMSSAFWPSLTLQNWITKLHPVIPTAHLRWACFTNVGKRNRLDCVWGNTDTFLLRNINVSWTIKKLHTQHELEIKWTENEVDIAKPSSCLAVRVLDFLRCRTSTRAWACAPTCASIPTSTHALTRSPMRPWCQWTTDSMNFTAPSEKTATWMNATRSKIILQGLAAHAQIEAAHGIVSPGTKANTCPTCAIYLACAARLAPNRHQHFRSMWSQTKTNSLIGKA